MPTYKPTLDMSFFVFQFQYEKCRFSIGKNLWNIPTHRKKKKDMISVRDGDKTNKISLPISAKSIQNSDFSYLVKIVI